MALAGKEWYIRRVCLKHFVRGLFAEVWVKQPDRQWWEAIVLRAQEGKPGETGREGAGKKCLPASLPLQQEPLLSPVRSQHRRLSRDTV